MQRGRSFNGTTDAVRAEGFPVGVYPVSFSCWINQAALAAAVLIEISSGTTNYLRLECDASGHGAIVADATTSSNVTTSTAMSTSTWTLFSASCFSATERYVWLNGAGKGSDVTSKQPVGPLTTVSIGADTNGTPSALLAGLMAQPAIYPSIALPETSWLSIYGGTRPETFGGIVLDLDNMRGPIKGAYAYRTRSTLTLPTNVGTSNGPLRAPDFSPFTLARRVRVALNQVTTEIGSGGVLGLNLPLGLASVVTGTAGGASTPTLIATDTNQLPHIVIPGHIF